MPFVCIRTLKINFLISVVGLLLGLCPRKCFDIPFGKEHRVIDFEKKRYVNFLSVKGWGGQRQFERYVQSVTQKVEPRKPSDVPF